LCGAEMAYGNMEIGGRRERDSPKIPLLGTLLITVIRISTRLLK